MSDLGFSTDNSLEISIPFRSCPIGSWFILPGWLVRAVHQDSNILINIKNHFFARAFAQGWTDTQISPEARRNNRLSLNCTATGCGASRRTPSATIATSVPSERIRRGGAPPKMAPKTRRPPHQKWIPNSENFWDAICDMVNELRKLSCSYNKFPL